MRTLCLFDIDGTLLSTGGAGQQAMERALAQTFGIEKINGNILAAGRTDRAITHDLFVAHNIKPNEDEWRQFQTTYFTELPKALAELDGKTLPGIDRLLGELAMHDDIALGLLTGNFEHGAMLKLSHYRIDHHFLFGGYGDHHFDRDDVARTAFAQSVKHIGHKIEADRVFVIGDTPADVRCARAINARAIAVATGIHSYSELEQTRPDRLFADFSDAAPFLLDVLGD